MRSVSQDTGLHYDRYLREVIEYLEKDPHFREKLKNANMDDIKVHTDQTAQCFVSWLLIWTCFFFIEQCYVDFVLAGRQTFQRAELCPAQFSDQAG